MQRKKRLIFVSAVCGALLLTGVFGMVFYRIVVSYGVQNEREGLLTWAVTAAAMIDAQKVRALEGSARDLERPEYDDLCQALRALKAISPDLQFVYIMRLLDGDVVFQVDAEPQDSEDFSAPGDVYEDASPELRGVFTDKSPIIEGPLKDAWGRWVTAIAPIIDPADGECVGILGLDIDAGQWENMVLFYRAFGASIPLFLAMLVIVFSAALYILNVINARLAGEISKHQTTISEKQAVVESLTLALGEIKTLRGIIPICSICKKVRNDSGYWGQVESYVSKHSDLVFSHGLCPECFDMEMDKARDELKPGESAGPKSGDEERTDDAYRK